MTYNKLYNCNILTMSEKSTAIQVFVRVRPLIGNETGTDDVVTVQQDGKTVNIATDCITNLQTVFDCAIPKQSTQKQVFALFQEYLSRIPQGYNMTVFAYGQTGSGKTYTMFGSDWQTTISKSIKVQHQNTFFQNLQSDENYAGLIPRTIFSLFEILKTYDNEKNSLNIYCSFLQIYNQKIYDLLQDFPKPKALSLHESKLDGIFVEGLAEYAVTHYLDCLQLMKRGQKNRFIRQTSMNTKSSRSHTIFQILIESTHPDSKGMFKKARLNLCDLAGSQKVNKSQYMDEAHFKELRSINQSLTTLGKVIASLSSQKRTLAAFRESKLTRLLQDSLTANTYTFIIGNISPSIQNMDQTMNTLKFVQRARHITMKVKPMQFNGQNMEIVNKLQKEIQYLKELLNMKRKGMRPDDIHSRLVHLQEENEKLRKNYLSAIDVEKLIEENRKMKIQIHKLQMTQYAHSDIDFDSKSNYSLKSNSKSQEPAIHSQTPNQSPHQFPQIRHGSSGFQLPYSLNSQNSQNIRHRSPTFSDPNYTPTLTKKSLISAGRLSLEPNQNSHQQIDRRREKNKILNKLQELQRIQKFNEEKLIKDLEQLEKKNTNSIVVMPKKKVTGYSGASTQGTGIQGKKAVNYEDKIKELEAKLFGK